MTTHHVLDLNSPTSCGGSLLNSTATTDVDAVTCPSCRAIGHGAMQCEGCHRWFNDERFYNGHDCLDDAALAAEVDALLPAGLQLETTPAMTYHCGPGCEGHKTRHHALDCPTTLVRLSTQVVSEAGRVLGAAYSPDDRLRFIAEAADNIERMKAELVAQARDAGLSWQAIGNQIGCTKQAAQQRYR